MFLKSLKTSALLTGVFFLYSCATPGSRVKEPVSPSGEEQKREEQKLILNDEAGEEIREKAQEYVLGPDDVIEVSVWRHSEADGTATVNPDGKVSLPVVGEVQAEGLTRLQLEKRIAGKLEKYYRSPLVRVVISAYNNRRVYVLGQVYEPGTQTLGGKPDLLRVISKAGGPTEDANLKMCSVVRGKGKIIKVNLYELLAKGNISLNIDIQPNDLIYVPDNTGNQVYVLGEVENPGLYSLKGEYTIADAVMSAGGPTEDALLGKTRIIRGDIGSPEVMTVSLEDVLKKGDRSKNILLEPRDIVYVPDRLMAKFNYFARQVLPSLQMIVLTDQAGDALSF